MFWSHTFPIDPCGWQLHATRNKENGGYLEVVLRYGFTDINVSCNWLRVLVRLCRGRVNIALLLVIVLVLVSSCFNQLILSILLTTALS